MKGKSFQPSFEETGERIAEDYYFAFFEFLAELNLPDTDCPIPLKLWTAIAQAFADASDYRIGPVFRFDRNPSANSK